MSSNHADSFISSDSSFQTAPFAAFHREMPGPTLPLRAAITAAYRLDEQSAVRKLVDQAEQSAASRNAIQMLARKLVENGVRFICVVAGGGPGNQQWDAHNDIEENHLRKAAEYRDPRN